MRRRDFAVLAGVAAAAPAASAPKRCRLIINWDQMNMWALPLTYANRGKTPEPGAVKAMLESIVDEHAKAKIDRIVHCVFALPRGTVNPGFKSFHRESTGTFRFYENTDTGIKQLEDSGQDFLQILLDRSHARGMEFLAGLRMNDRHGGSAKGPWALQHLDWQIDGIPGGMDYKHEGVRRAVLDYTREMLDRYNVDGVELDWMRWCHVFKPSEAAANAPILNEFMAGMRKILDDAGAKRGRKLILGARVPQTIEECRLLGYDIRTWARKNLVDFLCPSDFFHTDFNIRMEDFAAVTKGTRVKLYPSLHPWIARGNDFHVQSAENYRAAAHNYYSFGADGISVYNYQYHWRTDIAPESEWPRALEYLDGIGSRERVARGNRHYLFHPIWPKGSPTGSNNYYDVIRLARSNDRAAQQGEMRLRIAEKLASSHSGMLEFKVTGMADGDEIEVALNGKPVPAAGIVRTLDADGQDAKQGRALPAFYLYRMPLSAPLTRFGDNQLSVRLVKNVGRQELIVQEVEVRVAASRPARVRL